MRRALLFRPERCLLCLGCVLACEGRALGLTGLQQLAPGQRPPRRLEVAPVGGAPHAFLCRHCRQAPCAEACISGSIVRDERTGAVLHDADRCVGCGSCRLVCPFSAISGPDREGRMAKCNLCPDIETPPCAGACPTGALRAAAGEADDADAGRRRARHAREIATGGKHG